MSDKRGWVYGPEHGVSIDTGTFRCKVTDWESKQREIDSLTSECWRLEQMVKLGDMHYDALSDERDEMHDVIQKWSCGKMQSSTAMRKLQEIMIKHNEGR